MKGILDLLKRSSPPRHGVDKLDSMMFSSAFAEHDIEGSMLVPWEARANEVGAMRLPTESALRLLQAAWSKDRYMKKLDVTSVQQMERFFEFATVAADRDVIRQDEYGNFMMVLLSGSISIERIQPWGENLRLAEAKPGDILGEMSLLDSGMRFSQCRTLSQCEIAVLGADALDEMLTVEPLMAASLIGLLARKLSQRLRVVSARLTENRL
ncbi:MAG: putative transcriptional regulator, Crp/Fnr family [Polaromonas sp.]|nr:putative transcriptional regulator, Crp/Fnr family [Polaromonas sp.]